MASVEKAASVSAAQESSFARFSVALNKFAGGFQYVAMVTLFSMMAITMADVILRYAFKRPLQGTTEFLTYVLIVQVFGTVAFGQVIHRHVAVTFLYDKFSKRTQAVFISTTTLLTAFLFVLLAWRATVIGREAQTLRLRSMILHIPHYPFYYFIVFCFVLFVVVLIRDFIVYASAGTQSKKEITLRVLVSCIATIIVALCIWYGSGKLSLPPSAIGLLGFVLMLVLMFSGQAVGFAMALAGLIGVAFVRNLPATLQLAGSKPFDTVGYTYAVIPLFMLMGEFAYNGGLSRPLYAAAHSLVGRVSGGLAVANVLASILFGAICGDAVASSMALGSVALPEMKKFKYDPGLACATVVAGGTLSALVPPSMIMIIYCLMTQTSVSQLFMAGIFPGLLNAVLFSIVIIIRCRRNPALGPAGPSSTFKEKLVSVRGAWAAIILFGLIMGGIYGGFFTATEAGAAGAALALFVALALKGINGKKIVESLKTTTSMTSSSITMLVGAGFLTYFLGVSQVPAALSNLVVGLTVPREIILAAIVAIYFVLGLIMPGMAMILMTTPIFFPIVTTLGYDPLYFGVVVTVMMTVGGMTPPVGLLCFFISSATGTPLDTIFTNVWPFVGASLVGIVLMTIFPQIVLFLPQIMR